MASSRIVNISALKIIVLISLTTFGLTSKIFCQSNGIALDVDLINELSERGYENVTAAGNANGRLLVIEDSKYRYNVNGIHETIARMAYRLPLSTKKVILLFQKYGVPMACYESVTFQPYYSQRRKQNILVPQMGISNRTIDYWKIASRYSWFNRSNLKLDLILNPEIKARFGDYANPIKLQININPELLTLIAKGFLFSTSMVVPLYNELENDESFPRLGPTYFTLIKRFKEDIFFYSAGGYFYNYRYGLEGGLKKYFFKGLITLGGRVGVSGQAKFVKNVLEYSDIKDVSYSCDVTFYMRQYHTFLNASYNQFVYQDNGWRIDIFRFFDEFKCGFWILVTPEETNGGFHFSLPLPPKEYGARKRFRIRPAQYFNWQYSGISNQYSGVQLKANTYAEDLLIRYNPMYLHSKMGRAGKINN